MSSASQTRHCSLRCGHLRDEGTRACAGHSTTASKWIVCNEIHGLCPSRSSREITQCSNRCNRLAAPSASEKPPQLQTQQPGLSLHRPWVKNISITPSVWKRAPQREHDLIKYRRAHGFQWLHHPPLQFLDASTMKYNLITSCFRKLTAATAADGDGDADSAGTSTNSCRTTSRRSECCVQVRPHKNDDIQSRI